MADPFPSSEQGIAGQSVAGQTHEARERVHKISAPVLITVGSADRTTVPAQSRFMHENIKGSEFFIFDDAAHFPQFQMPAEFASITIGFMTKHGTRAH
jgi:3-oxoadipate enol-lactonase